MAWLAETNHQAAQHQVVFRKWISRKVVFPVSAIGALLRM
jgi:hypothetical protein